MIRCLIVDDEPLGQEVLATYVRQMPGLTLVGKCSTATAAFELLHREKADLLFLDIKLPGLNGIDFIRALKDPPAVIFTTAYAEFAATSYDLEAVDYLLKPITFGRFKKSMDKFLKLQPKVMPEEKDYTYFKVSGKLVKVFHHDILYAQSVKDYILLSTAKGNLIIHMTMKYLDSLLSAAAFIRVHRSYLVNRKAIDRIDKKQVWIGELAIPIGQNYKGHAFAKAVAGKGS